MFKNLGSFGLLAAGAGLMVAGLSGCPSYTFLEVLPERVTENQIIIEPGKPVPADILFVVDNSCSMEDEQELLARNFDAFIAELTQAKADYRIGVVTTDLADRGGGLEWEGIRVSSFGPPPMRRLQGVNADNCRTIQIEHGCFRGPDSANRVVTSAMTADEQVQRFGANVRVGSCGDGEFEEGLAGMIRGLERASGSDCNAGFLRDGANLVLVLVSDEDDYSRARPGLSNEIQALVDRLGELKPLAQVRIAAIVGASLDASGPTAARCSQTQGTSCGGACQEFSPVQGSQQACAGDTCPAGEQCGAFSRQCVEPDYFYWNAVNCGWCTYYNTGNCCSALAGTRYLEFARALESRVSDATSGAISATRCAASADPQVRVGCLVDSICQADFSQTLKKIATDLVIDIEVSLNPPAAYPPGVVVTVNGVEWKNGVDYSINETGTRLRYLRTPAPSTGDVVEVFYTLPN